MIYHWYHIEKLRVKYDRVPNKHVYLHRSNLHHHSNPPPKPSYPFLSPELPQWCLTCVPILCGSKWCMGLVYAHLVPGVPIPFLPLYYLPTPILPSLLAANSSLRLIGMSERCRVCCWSRDAIWQHVRFVGVSNSNHLLSNTKGR